MLNTNTLSQRTSNLTGKLAIASGGALADELGLMGARMSYARNEEIFGEGEPAEYLYKVVSGAVRTCRILDDGRRQVSAFYMSGDFFGLARHAGDRHRAGRGRPLARARRACRQRRRHRRLGVFGRARFGRIAIANSDSGMAPYTDVAIDQAHRAVHELIG